jgi:hypothetical protein
MDAATRAAVRARAGNCCEYCHRRQSISPLIPLHIEHIVSRKHHGSNNLDNLALACSECNLHKGSDLTGLDPDTGAVTVLFNPRRDLWSDHFMWSGLHIVGVSAVGRTTVRLLQMNSLPRVRVRRATALE